MISSMLLRRALAQVGFRDYISWFVAPDAGHLAGRIGERMTVYYVTDNYAHFPGVDAGEVGRLDLELSRKAQRDEARLEAAKAVIFDGPKFCPLRRMIFAVPSGSAAQSARLFAAVTLRPWRVARKKMTEPLPSKLPMRRRITRCGAE